MSHLIFRFRVHAHTRMSSKLRCTNINSSQESRTLTCELLKQQKKQQENIQLDTFSSIVEMEQKMKSKCSLLGIIQAKKGDAFLFLSLTDGEPRVKYCLRVLESFTFEIWLNGKMIHPSRCNIIVDKTITCSMIMDILTY